MCTRLLLLLLADNPTFNEIGILATAVRVFMGKTACLALGTR